MRGLRGVLLATVLAASLAACAAIPRVAVSEADAKIADPIGFKTVRVWSDAPRGALLKSFSQDRPSPYQTSVKRTYLALSGGSDDGAFGAGFLKGWSATGQRPRFDIVSGVSTGALIAPFAFLGEQYDSELQRVYTTLGQADVAVSNGLAVLLSTSLYDTGPLRRIIDQYVTLDFLEKIAEEHAKGRLLIVVTTNLDTQRGVVWDMGAIASRRNVEALRLFKSVLIASASIPGVFPPVMIDVQAGDKRFTEMHVDGGATAQVMTVPETLLTSTVTRRFMRDGTLDIYVLVNGRLNPEFKVVPKSLLDISERSFSTLLKSHTRSSMQNIYSFARANGFSFRWSDIGTDFSTVSSEPFDQAYMRALFDYGFAKARSRAPWNGRSFETGQSHSDRTQ
jgi:predicted acylesterase/phospholipase RssA